MITTEVLTNILNFKKYKIFSTGHLKNCAILGASTFRVNTGAMHKFQAIWWVSSCNTSPMLPIDIPIPFNPGIGSHIPRSQAAYLK